MSRKRNFEIILTGIIAYFILTLFLYGLQRLTNLSVYSLLVNYEFIPLFQVNPLLAHILNLIISVILAYFFDRNIFKRAWRWQDILFHVTFGIMFVGVVTYPLTYFSDITPPLFHIFSFVFWIVSFMIYGLSMSLGFIYFLNKVKTHSKTDRDFNENKKVIPFNRKS